MTSQSRPPGSASRLAITLAAALVTIAALPGAATAARVAHEGFLSPLTVTSTLQGFGHQVTALTAAQVEGGALTASHFDVSVVGRYTAARPATALYVAQVGAYLAGGGNVVAEFTGADMFFSSYASDVTPLTAMATPQLKVFDGVFHAGGVHQTQTPVVVVDPRNSVALGLPSSFAEFNGETSFHWVEGLGPDVSVVGLFTGNGTPGFPLGEPLPCLLVGTSGHSVVVVGSWNWSDTIGISGWNRLLFKNAVATAARGSNLPPVPEIAPPAIEECRGAASMVVLDGTRSRDPEGDALTYLWTTECQGASFDDATSPAPRLTVPADGPCGADCAVTLTVSDGVASVSVSTAVTFEDRTAPVVSLVGPAYLVLERGRDTYVEQGALALDLCDPAVPVVIGGDEVDPFTRGTYLVTYDARDGCGNAAGTVTRTVVVEDPIPPAFVALPPDLVLECPGPEGVPSDDPRVTAFLEAPRVNEGCDPAAGIVNDAPAQFHLGDTVVTWTARDLDGGEVLAQGLVSVVDTTPPVMVTPADAVVECPADTSVESLGAAGATDLCGDASVAWSDAFEPACGSTGTIVRTWTATDGWGNTATAVQRIQITDKTAPSITLHGPAELVLEAGMDSYVEAGASCLDRCDGDLSVTVGGDVPDARVPGVYLVTYDASDLCGNAAPRATRRVEVRDTVPPSFVALPGDLTLECPGEEGVPVSDAAVTSFLAGARASDSCDGSVGVVHDAPEAFLLGDTLVTWTARDGAGNLVTASRMVHVVDTTPPTLYCPADVLAEAPHDTGVEENGAASAEDPCSGAEVTYADTRVPGCGVSETVTRTWTAVDGEGNKTVCAQTIRVVDTSPPEVLVWTEPLDQGQRFIVRFVAGDASGVTDLSAVVDTGCRTIPVYDGEVMKLTGADFACRPQSNASRIARLVVTASDPCGNRASGVAEVSVPLGGGGTVSGSAFLRGDADLNGRLDMGDPIAILLLALHRGKTRCLDAADADDNGRVDLLDAVAVLQAILGRHALPPPFPRRGFDPTPDGLGCDLGCSAGHDDDDRGGKHEESPGKGKQKEKQKQKEKDKDKDKDKGKGKR